MTREIQEADVVTMAADLAPEIRAALDEMETLGHLPESLVGAMDQAGLFQLYLPRSMGGPETDPITASNAALGAGTGESGESVRPKVPCPIAEALPPAPDTMPMS